MALVMLLIFAGHNANANVVESKYYFEKVVNAGKDTGYSKNIVIKKDDPHYGWQLGRFCVDGYSRCIEVDGNPVFLKTVGDTVTLWFELQQNIKKLNGDANLYICEDTNGYDEYFGVEKTNFGKGTLIIRKVDYQNHSETYPIYVDYLVGLEKDAKTKISLCEEGDYEVVLDYEIKEILFSLGKLKVFSKYHDYRIYCKFSVRNGNCMVYPFDAETHAELTNGVLTENGFYLDFANSQYLSIDIKKEIRKDGAEGLVEDTRFNKPAKDREVFTDEGVYTITAHNKYTNQTTTKIIYVGTDDVLRAYASLGGTITVSEIERLIDDGATVSPDGLLLLSTGEVISYDETNEVDIGVDNRVLTNGTQIDNKYSIRISVIVVGFIIVSIVVAIMVFLKNKRKSN